MDKPILSPFNEINEFLLTPYKISLAVLIQTFTEQRNRHSQKEIGAFCILIMKLIHGLDLPYPSLMNRLKSCSRLNQELIDRVRDRIERIKNSGACGLLDIIQSVNVGSWITRSSFLGIFVRRLQLYFDKLSFSGVLRLYEDFKIYVADGDASLFELGTFELDEHDPLRLNMNVCPKQIQYFTCNQTQFIMVNEKRAISPDLLARIILDHEEQNSNGCVLNFDLSSDHYRRETQLNDINFLKYLNQLRIREYVQSKEALFAYFDGIPNYISRCWPALNLAMFYYNFDHHSLSIESLKECVSAAQDSNDDKCLEYALVWIAKIITCQRDQAYSDEDILAILHHLQVKATKLDLPHLAAFASLLQDQLTGLQFRKSSEHGGTQNHSTEMIACAELIAVKNSLSELLMMSYMNKSANYAQVGDSNLMALAAQAMLHLHVVENVADEIVFCIEENFAIALSIVAYYIWTNMGEYEIAKNVLMNLSKSLFSPYNSKITAIWKSTMAKIDFEHYLYHNQPREAQQAAELIMQYDHDEGLLRCVELHLKKGDRQKAYTLVCNLLKKKTFTPHFEIRALLLKAQILDDISSIFASLNLAIEYKLKGLENLILIELAFQLNRIGQLSQSLRLVRSRMVNILTNQEQREIGKAYYLLALNTCFIIQRDDQTQKTPKKSTPALPDSPDHRFDSVLENNTNAIEILKKIGDYSFLRDAYRLQAEVYDLIGNQKKRNHFANLYRQLVETVF